MTVTLDFLSAGAAESTIRALAAREGTAIRGHFGPVGGNRQRLLAGEPCDVIVLTAPMIDELTQSGRVLPGSVAVLGRVATALAAVKGTTPPSIADEAGLRAALLDASSIHCPDPSVATAGAHFMKIIERLGLAEMVGPKLRKASGGAAAMLALAASADKRALGCTQVTEIKANSAVELVAPLPMSCALVTTYSAGVAAQAKSPDAARRFIALLTGQESKALRASAGFDVQD